jgi:hypothetical protein
MNVVSVNIDDYRAQREARLPRFLYDYIRGGSFDKNTLHANIAGLGVSNGVHEELARDLRRYLRNFCGNALGFKR